MGEDAVAQPITRTATTLMRKNDEKKTDERKTSTKKRKVAKITERVVVDEPDEKYPNTARIRRKQHFMGKQGGLHGHPTPPTCSIFEMSHPGSSAIRTRPVKGLTVSHQTHSVGKGRKSITSGWRAQPGKSRRRLVQVCPLRSDSDR
jgi:hypothetical protein